MFFERHEVVHEQVEELAIFGDAIHEELIDFGEGEEAGLAFEFKGEEGGVFEVRGALLQEALGDGADFALGDEQVGGDLFEHVETVILKKTFDAFDEGEGLLRLEVFVDSLLPFGLGHDDLAGCSGCGRLARAKARADEYKDGGDVGQHGDELGGNGTALQAQ